MNADRTQPHGIALAACPAHDQADALTPMSATPPKEADMAKAGDGIYKIVEVIGTSSSSWEDAAKKAVETASKSLRDLRVAEVVKQDMKIENGKVTAFRTRVLLSFKYED